MIGVLIVPTGIGAEIGGHSGDANPAAKLLGACCDKLILHPNVVNGSDINEMPPNALYVDGYSLDRFMVGAAKLREVHRPNRIIVVANKPVQGETINAVAAARSTLGIDASIVELDTPLLMRAEFSGDRLIPTFSGHEELAKQIKGMEFDALAIHTPIRVSQDVVREYYKRGGINPWGGVEAVVSRAIGELVCKPVAHAPVEITDPSDEDIFFVYKREVDPRMAAEAISNCHLHCVLKGLHFAPRIERECDVSGRDWIDVGDVDFMVAPHGCWGLPHDECFARGIPIIAVRENKTVESYAGTGNGFNVTFAENYLEAAGMVMAMRAGIHPSSVRRPLSRVPIIRSTEEKDG